MELVYLWVEEYKNIHKQGFNFSPRFSCTYENDELKIIDKEETKEPYLKNFFGDNINVTAIVGKNGSGKSNLVDFIVQLLDNRSKMTTNYLLIIENNGNELYCKTNIKIEKPPKCFIKDDENIEMKHYSYSNQKKDFHKISLEKYDIVNQLIEIYQHKKLSDFHLSTFMFLPIEISILPIEIDKLFQNFMENDYIEKIKDRGIKFAFRNENEDNNKIEQELNARKNNLMEAVEKEEGVKQLYYKYLVLYFHNYLESHNSYYDDFFKSKTRPYVLDGFQEDDNIDALEKQCKNHISFENFKKYFKERKVEMASFEKIEKDIYLDEHKYLFEIDFIDSKQRSYNHLSHGEQTLFGELVSLLFCSLLSYDTELKKATLLTDEEKNKQLNSIFLFDEPDISLHPDWQKKYLNEIIVLLQKMKKSYHFIFTTHSPFLLSDLPKQNIIFLDKDKDGNCKVVDGLKEKKQTFGANIHTLLSDSFLWKMV